METLTTAEKNKQIMDTAFLIGIVSGLLLVDYLFEDEKH